MTYAYLYHPYQGNPFLPIPIADVIYGTVPKAVKGTAGTGFSCFDSSW